VRHRARAPKSCRKAVSEALLFQRRTYKEAHTAAIIALAPVKSGAR
jgi:hypothetical protein